MSDKPEQTEAFTVTATKPLASMNAKEVQEFSDKIEQAAKDKVRALRALAKALA